MEARGYFMVLIHDQRTSLDKCNRACKVFLLNTRWSETIIITASQYFVLGSRYENIVLTLYMEY